MKKILLLGGTGAIGNYVAKYCSELGYKVFITSRSRRLTKDKDIEFIYGNAKDYNFVKQLLSSNRYDCIIDFMVYKTQEFKQQIDILATNTDHYIFLSSYRVYHNNGFSPLKEESPRLLNNINDFRYLTTDEYALSKARQEDILLSLNTSNWTILRPSITYSSDRFQLGTLEANVILPRALMGLPVILPQEILNCKTTLTWAGDSGKMISNLILHNKALGNIYNVSTNESLLWRSVAEIYKNVINLKVVNVSLLEYQALKLNPYQLIYDRLFNRVCSNEKIMQIDGMHGYTFKSAEEGLTYELRKINFEKWCNSYSRIHGRMDKILGLNRLKEAIRSGKGINYYIGYNSLLNNIYGILNRKKRL